MYDIVIIGAGPAGLTAAIYARRANRSVLIMDKNAFGGQMTFSPKLENYPGYELISGTELADKMVEQVINQGATVEIENALEIKNGGKTKTVITEDGKYECRAVIIAGGAKHRKLGIENEEKFIGDGISFCAVCDGAFYKNKTVAVIGGGNSALQEAILLSETCKKVYLVQNLDFLTGEKKLEEILRKKENVEIITGTVVTKVADTETLSSIHLKKLSDSSEGDLFIDGMFVAIGLEPENEAFSNVAELDKAGYLDSGEDCLTKTPGIFAAGDCRKKTVRQITTAVSDGAAAAVAACRYLDELDA